MKNTTQEVEKDAAPNVRPGTAMSKNVDSGTVLPKNIASGTAEPKEVEKQGDAMQAGENKGFLADVKPLIAVSHIIVHCSATPEGVDVSAADIDRYHRSRGFACIGYHWVVRRDGQIERGRSESLVGAHCRGLNRCSIGVCYVGGIDAAGHPKDTRTAAQRTSLRHLLSELRRRYPQARIYGHRDFAPKACPCFDATKEYAEL